MVYSLGKRKDGSDKSDPYNRQARRLSYDIGKRVEEKDGNKRI